MASSTPKILLTGATGFIGGTVLTQLLTYSSPVIKGLTITCLIRGEDRVSKLRSAYGARVNPILYAALDDTETTTAAANKHDIVINTTLGFHSASAQALLAGLAQRRKETGRDVWMIHTSGASNIADQPISRTYVDSSPDREFDDEKDDIYAYEQQREALHPYPQRATELGVVDAGLQLGVKTVVVMASTVYGVGTGLFNKISIQMPTYIRAVLEYGRAFVVEGGEGEGRHVHVEDLACLYSLLLLDILESGGKNLPTGKKGILFAENGRYTWAGAAQLVADACFEEGLIMEKKVESVSLREGAKFLSSYLEHTDEGDVAEKNVELGLASNARTVASIANRLGWRPTRGEEDWRKGFRDDLKAVMGKVERGE